MKVDTINIRSVKIHNPEHILPSTDGYGGERAADATTTNTGYTNITYTVSIRVFEAPSPDLLNDEASRGVAEHPMDEMIGPPLYPLTEASGSVVGEIIYHVMDAFTVEMPPTHPLP